MKKLLPVIAAAICLALVFCSCNFLMPRRSEPDEYDFTIPDFTVTDFTLPDFTVSDFTTPSIEVPTYDDGDIDDGEGMSIGDSRVGYMTVPCDFIEFRDVRGGNDLQYSDKTGTIIFTMNVIEGSEDAETAAQGIASHLKEEGIEDLTGATVKVGNYDAVQIYGYYSDDNKYLVIDLIPHDGCIYYVSAEFPPSQVDMYEYVNTWEAP